MVWRFRQLLVLVVLQACAFAELKRQARLGAAFTEESGKLVLLQVAPDGSAARAGLRTGDIVTAVDGQKASPTAAFVRPLLRRDAGAKVRFAIARQSESKTLTVEYAAPPLEKPEGIDVVYGSVAVNGHERRTLLTLPSGKAGKPSSPAILFLAGSGCVSQESPDGRDPAVQILYELTRRGFVTMRVEKTGIGDSTGPACYSADGDLMQEVAGYKAGHAALSAHASVDPKRIFLFGHSAGGTLAPLVASDNLAVAGIVAAGAMGTDFLRYILAMRERERRLEGRADEEIAKSMKVTTACLTRLLKDGETPDAIEQQHPECKKQVRFDSPPAYVEQWNRLDLQQAWSQVKAPTLVLYGTGDFVTSEEESAALVAKINKGGNPQQARLEVLPMDHGFFAHSTPERSWRAEQGVVPPAGLLIQVIDTIAEFAAAAGPKPD